MALSHDACSRSDYYDWLKSSAAIMSIDTLKMYRSIHRLLKNRESLSNREIMKSFVKKAIKLADTLFAKLCSVCV